MGGDDARNDRQAQPGAAGGPAARVVGAIEALEDVSGLLLGQARPGVGDVDDGTWAISYPWRSRLATLNPNDPLARLGVHSCPIIPAEVEGSVHPGAP